METKDRILGSNDIKGTEIESEIPQGGGRSSKKRTRRELVLREWGRTGLWERWGQLFPQMPYYSSCRLKRPLWKENSEKHKSRETAWIYKGKPRYWFSLYPQEELLRSNLETRGCPCEPRKDPSLHFTWMYQWLPLRTFRDNKEGVALFCILGVGLPVGTLLCRLYLVILGPRVIYVINKSKPRLLSSCSFLSSPLLPEYS